MRSVLARLSWLAVAAAVLLIIAGCNGGNNGMPQVTSTYAITITPNPVNAVPGQPVQMTAVVTLVADGSVMPGAAVTWGVTGDVGTISDTGLFTAGQTTPASGTITAAAFDATAGVPVTLNASGQTLASITVTAPGANLNAVPAATTVQFVATGADTQGNPMAIAPTWDVQNGIGQINAQGLFQAGTAGTGAVTASVGAISGSAVVTVVPGTPVELSLAVTGNADTNNLVIGQQVHFTAALVDGAGNRGRKRSVTDATWSVTGGVGSIDQDGAFIATALGHGTVVAVKDSLTASVPVTVTRAFSGAIAFTRQNLNGNLAVLTGDGSISDLTTGSNHFGEADWSPDAGKLIFAARDVAGSSGIFGMHADGTGTHLIYGAIANDPAWSPDGMQICYASDTGVVAGELVVVTAGGQFVRKLVIGTLGTPKNPAWSPDGLKVAFIVNTGYSPTDGVYIMNADGAGPITRIYTGHPVDIAWKPGTSSLAVAENARVYLVPADGSDATLLLSEPKAISAFAWAPNGSAIVCSESNGAYNQLFLRVIGTSIRVPLTNLTSASALDPAWK